MKKIREKIQIIFKKEEFFLILIFLLANIFSFFLGKMSSLEQENASLREVNASSGEEVQEIVYVASKNGSVYHLPWCSGALKMSEENKIFFETKDDAENDGYRAAKNCDGLQ